MLGLVDGRPAFHASRIGAELTPGWPLTSMPELVGPAAETRTLATDGKKATGAGSTTCEKDDLLFRNLNGTGVV